MRMRVRRLAAMPALFVAALLTVCNSHDVRADGALAPIWTGVYAGFHGGALWSDLNTDFSSSFSATEATGGGHVGFNTGLGGAIVGLEADADIDGVEYGYSTSGGSGEFSTDWSGTIRGRVGLPVGPALIYATAGYAWSSASVSEKSGGASSSDDVTFHGVVYGAGVETKVLPNLSLRLEALRFDYASEELSLSGASAAVQEFDPSDTVVRAGVTFHLN